MPAALVERFYSNGLYPKLQSLLAPVANSIPFAFIDLFIIALALGLPAWWARRLMKAGRGRRLKTLGRLAFNTAVAASIAFLIFQLLWGLNYARKPLAAKLDFDEERLTPEAIRGLKRLAVERLNAEYAEGRAAWPNEKDWREQLHWSFDQVTSELGNARSIKAEAPKSSVLNFYLAATGIEGFMNPFGYEVILDSEALPFERPFLLAHEWAHLAGFADEAEASFVGLLACLRSDSAAIRYSGWLALYQFTPWPVTASTEDMQQALRFDPPPRPLPEVIADLKAIRERVSRHRNNFLSRAQWFVYDGFLKANRVRAGIGSYGRVVRLIAGTRFESGWIPARRAE